MNTAEFVAKQLRTQPDDRIIPDRIYMQNIRIYTITLLKRLKGPHTAAHVFNDGYLYEGGRVFAYEPNRYYPNAVIPWPLVLSLR